jgi:outer membrane biosynthesis protein TonB
LRIRLEQNRLAAKRAYNKRVAKQSADHDKITDMENELGELRKMVHEQKKQIDALGTLVALVQANPNLPDVKDFPLGALSQRQTGATVQPQQEQQEQEQQPQPLPPPQQGQPSPPPQQEQAHELSSEPQIKVQANSTEAQAQTGPTQRGDEDAASEQARGDPAMAAMLSLTAATGTAAASGYDQFYATAGGGGGGSANPSSAQDDATGNGSGNAIV